MTGIDAGAFHDFEQAGWERAAGFYGDAFGALTAQTAQPLLDAVGAESGIRMLDVATGPGFIAAAAAKRGASVVGLDFSAAMLAEAARLHPGIAFREGDAEAHRVLRPGGRYAFTVWAAPERAVAFGMTLRAVEQFGTANVPLPEGPPFFRFSDAAETARTLASLGFTGVAVRELPLTWRVVSADTVFDAMSRGGVRTAAVLRAQTPEALAAIRDALRRGVEGYAAGGGYEIPMPAVLASCRRR